MFRSRHGVAPDGSAQGDQQLTHFNGDSNTPLTVVLLHGDFYRSRRFRIFTGIYIPRYGIYIPREIASIIDDYLWGDNTGVFYSWGFVQADINGSNGEATNTDDLDHAGRVRAHREAQTTRHHVNRERGANRGGYGPIEPLAVAVQDQHVIDIRPLFEPDDYEDFTLFSSVEHQPSTCSTWLNYFTARIAYILITWTLSVGLGYLYFRLLSFLLIQFSYLKQEIFMVCITSAPLFIYGWYRLVCWVYKMYYVPEFDIVDFYSVVHNYGGRLRSELPTHMLPAEVHGAEVHLVRAMPAVDYNYYRTVRLSKSFVDRIDRACHVSTRSMAGLHDYVLAFIYEQVGKLDQDERFWWDNLDPNTREDYKQAIYQRVLTRMIRASTYARDSLPQFRRV